MLGDSVPPQQWEGYAKSFHHEEHEGGEEGVRWEELAVAAATSPLGSWGEASRLVALYRGAAWPSRAIRSYESLCYNARSELSSAQMGRGV